MAAKKKSPKKPVAGDEVTISDERYRRLFQSSSDAIMLLDSGRFFDCNPATLEMFGLTKEIFIKLHPSEISPPRQANGRDSRAEADRMIDKAFKKGSNKFEWIHRRSNGEDFPATVWLTAFHLEGRHILQATVREITSAAESVRDLEAHRLKLQEVVDEKSAGFTKEVKARKRVEGDVRRLLKAVETSFNAVALLDMDMNFVYANREFCRMVGIESGTITGRNAKEFVPKKSMKIIMDGIEANMAGMEPERFEVKAINAKGREFWVEIAGSVLFDDRGEPEGLLAIVNDITERREILNALKESEEKFKMLVERSLDGILIIQDGKVAYMNPALLELSGYTMKEQLGRDFIENAAPESRKLIKDRYRARMEGKEVPAIYETILLAKDGTRVHMEVNAGTMEYGGRPADFVYLRDLTARRRAEEALKSTEHMLRTVLDNIPARVFWKDRDLKYLGCNMQFARDSGLESPWDLIGKDDFQMGWKEQADMYRADDRAVIESGEPKIGYEEPQTTPDGDMIWVRTSKVPLKNTADDIIGVLGTYEDITEFKKASEEIRTLKEQFEYVLGATKTGFDLIDEDCNLLYVDPQWAEKLGDYTGKKCHDYFMGRKKPCKGCAIPKALKSGKPVVSEEYLKKEGRHIEVHIIPMESYRDKRVVAEFNVDITERKITEDMLKLNEARYRELAEGISSGLAVYEAVDNGRDFVFLDFNRAAEDIEGITREKVIGRKVTDVFSGIKKMGLLNVFKRVWRTGKPEHYPLSLYKKGKVSSWRENYVYKLPSGEIVAIYNDITARKQAEEEIRNYSEQLQGINENLADGMVYQIDGGKDGKKPVFTYLSPAVERMRGIKWEDAMRNPRLLYDQVIEEDRELMHKTRAETFAKREKMDMQLRIRLPGGQVKWHRFLAVPSEDGNDIWNGIELDITEDKIQEDALRASEQINRSIVDSSPWGMYIYELKDDDRLVFSGYNAAADRIIGLDNSQFMGKTIEEAFPQLKKTEAPKRYREVARTGETWNSDQLDYDEQDIRGAFEVTAFRISPKRIIVAFQDISDSKLAERALRESETKHRLLMEKANDAIFLADADTGVLIDVNDKACQLTGRSRKELIGMHQSKLHPPREAKKYQQIFKDHVKKGTVIQEEIAVQRKDGSMVPISISASVFELQGKKVNQGIFHDLTERLEAERALESSREQLNALFQASTSGIGVESEGKLFFVNPAFLEMFGYSDEEELAGKPLASVVAPKDRKRVKGYSKLRLKRKAPSSYEFAGIRKDGTTFDIEASVSTYQIDKKAYYVGFVQDITERKNAERVMKESEARFRRMAENIHDGLTIIEDGKVTYVNERACEIYGYPPEELMKKAPLDMAVPEDRVQLQAIMKNARKTGKRLGELEFWVQAKDGSRRYVRTRISSSKAGGSTSEFIITTDITARKQAEDENKRRMMKFLLEDGRIYLVKEFLPGMSIEAFNDLLNLEYFGLVISRTPKKDIAKSIKGPFDYMWLGEKEDGRELFENILSAMNRFGGKSVVLIDRLDYLVFKYGFKETLDFIFRLRDMAYLKEMVVIISIDPSTMDEGELNIMRKEMGEVEQRQVPRPPEEIFEIVQLIYEKNSAGIKPSFSDIGEELKISKPTFRKRVRRLINAGYAIVLTKGNRKVLELTQKGRNLFFK